MGLNLNMITIYTFHHCPSLPVTPAFEPTTFRPFDQSPVTLTTRPFLYPQTSPRDLQKKTSPRAPTATPREKLHLCEAAGGGLLVVPINAPVAPHLFRVMVRTAVVQTEV